MRASGFDLSIEVFIPDEGGYDWLPETNVTASVSFSSGECSIPDAFLVFTAVLLRMPPISTCPRIFRFNSLEARCLDTHCFFLFFWDT